VTSSPMTDSMPVSCENKDSLIMTKSKQRWFMDTWKIKLKLD